MRLKDRLREPVSPSLAARERRQRPHGYLERILPPIIPSEEDEMAYGIVHHFADGTKEQYEASIAAVHPGEGQLPQGQIFHAAGPDAGGGWTIVAVHDSKD